MEGTKKRGFRKALLLLLTSLLLFGIVACSSSNDKGSEPEQLMMDQNTRNSLSKNQTAVNFSSAEEVTKSDNDAAAAPSAGSLSAEKPAANAINGESIAGVGIGPIADADAGFGRKVIYQANLVMKVEKYIDAEEQLLNLIHLSDAYVLEFSDSRNSDEVGATYVIKVPSAGFSPFLEQLQKIKTLKFERQVSGNDVTEEFVDLESRLKAKQTVEERLLAFMDKAINSNDLVKFSNELANVQEEIERIKGRMRYLDQNVAFSTINLRLYQGSGLEEPAGATDEDKGFGERLSDALTGSTKVLRQFGELVLVVIAAMLPVLVVVIVIGIPVYLLIRKRNGNRRVLSEERRKAMNEFNRTPSGAESDAEMEYPTSTEIVEMANAKNARDDNEDSNNK